MQESHFVLTSDNETLCDLTILHVAFRHSFFAYFSLIFSRKIVDVNRVVDVNRRGDLIGICFS